MTVSFESRDLKKSTTYFSLLTAAMAMCSLNHQRGFTFDEPRARTVNSNRGRKAQAKAALTTKERVEQRRARR